MTAPSSTPLRLNRVPAGRGVLWMRQGFQVFLRKPFAFTGLLATVLVATMLLSLIPALGVLAMLVFLPTLTLVFMMATQLVLKGGTPMPVQLIVPLRADPKRRNTLLKLGAAYAVATFLIVVLSAWADGGAMDALESAIIGGTDPTAALDDPRLQYGLLLRLGLTALLSVPFWHAPALVWWGGQGLGQSLFSSTLACWRARGAFLVYGLAWAAVFIVMATLMALIFGLLGSRELLAVAAIPTGLIFSTAFYTSLYFTFVDSFSAAVVEVPTAEA